MDEQALRQRLSNRLKQLRDRERLSQAEVALRVGVVSRQYQKWETGEVMPLISSLMALAEVFGVDIVVLVAPERSDGKLSDSALLDLVIGMEERIKELEQDAKERGL